MESNQFKLDYTERIVYEVKDWRQIEKLAREYFEDPYLRLPYCMNCLNPTDYMFHVREIGDRYDKEAMREKLLRRFKEAVDIDEDDLYIILEYYATKGWIPFGQYRVTIWW